MMMFILVQNQLGNTRNRRRYFAAFGVLGLSLFFITQIHHATLKHSSLSQQREIGDVLTSLPPYYSVNNSSQSTPSLKMEAGFLLGGTHRHATNNNNNEHRVQTRTEIQIGRSKEDLVPPAKILALAEKANVQQRKEKQTKPKKIPANKKSNNTGSNNARRRRPPLEKLVKGDDITGNVSWLLDFAILGHAKCATTFLNSWFREHPDVQTWDREVCDLNNRKPADLVRKLYQELPVGDEYLRGYKCPGHFSREPLRNIRRYFGRARLIVGLRHPIRWFESYFNFRIRHPRGGVMPPADRLIGKCVHESQGVCTDRANFHRNLAMFGKTNSTDPVEQQLLHLPARYDEASNALSLIPNRVFLYDVGQLYDKDETRTALFRKDLGDFLGLKTPLASSAGTHDNTTTTTTTSDGKKKTAEKKYAHIDICHSDYDAIRRELLEIGSRAAEWIVNYFLKSDQVVVSSPNFFADTLENWKEDPCTKVAVKSKV